jgi:hypothetical protein
MNPLVPLTYIAVTFFLCVLVLLVATNMRFTLLNFLYVGVGFFLPCLLVAIVVFGGMLLVPLLDEKPIPVWAGIAFGATVLLSLPVGLIIWAHKKRHELPRTPKDFRDLFKENRQK